MNEPVLNELSLEPAEQLTSARMQTLIEVLKKLSGLGFPRILRHGRDALTREVEAGLSFRAWLFQKAPRDMRGLLGGYLQKAPFVEELHERGESAMGALVEASHRGVSALGLGAAYLHGAPAVALCGTPQWDVDPLEILLTRIGQGEDGDAVEDMTAEVVHLCYADQVDKRAPMLRERILRAVSSGSELWSRRDELFPSLRFGGSVHRQMSELSGNEFYFHAVVEALSRLDAALATWSSGPLQTGMSSSPESATTLSHSRYGPMRDFACPDGQTRRFSNHLKLFSNNWRIYFLEARADDGRGQAVVGYIGPHLPTVKYPT